MTKIGTLKELGVKPGDVVEFMKGYVGMYPELVGHKYTIDEYGDPIHNECEGKSFISCCDHKFRIISSATETTKLWRDMTPEEKGALLLAHRDGKVIEWVSGGKVRRSNEGYTPFWGDIYAYRVKPERAKSDWSAWFTSKADGKTKLDLDTCAEVERVALGDSKQFAYRVKKWVE